MTAADIAVLIERINGPLSNVDRNEKADQYKLMVSAAERHCRLAALPLPQEIAGLIAEAQHEYECGHGLSVLFGNLAVALRAQAQEIESIRDKLTRQIDKTEVEAERGGNIENDLDAANERILALAQENAGLNARIRQLEAELDAWKQCARVEAQVRREFKELLEAAEAERDAIRDEAAINGKMC